MGPNLDNQVAPVKTGLLFVTRGREFVNLVYRENISKVLLFVSCGEYWGQFSTRNKAPVTKQQEQLKHKNLQERFIQERRLT